MSIRTNTLYSTILQVLNVIFPIVTAPYVSRVLGVDGVGAANFVVAYTSYFVIFAVLSAPFYGIREIAKAGADIGNRNRVFSEIFFLTTIASAVSSVFYIASIYGIEKLYADRVFLWVSGLTLFFAPLNIDWYFTGIENLRYITVRSIYMRILSLGALFIFVRSRNDITAYIVISAVGGLGANLWSIVYAYKNKLRLVFRGLHLGARFKKMMPLFVGAVAVSIYTLLDTLMLGFMTTDAQVGYYTQPFRLSRVLLSIAIAVAPVIVARINQYRGLRQTDRIRPLLARAFDLILVVSLPLCVGLAVVSPRFVPFFFGEEFLPSIVPMQLLSLLVLIIGMAYVFKVMVFGAMEKDKLTLWISIATALLNFGVNLLFIPRWGAVGAAMASVLAEGLSLVVGFFLAQRIIRLRFRLVEVLKPVVAALTFIPLSWGLSALISSDIWYLLLMVTCGTLIYAIALLAMRSVFGLYLYEIIRCKVVAVWHKWSCGARK